MSTPLLQAKVLPWGQLVELPKGKIFDLTRSKHCVGRVSHRCDIQIPHNFISALHCIIRLQGKDDRGEPIVEIEDVSRNGLWVNDAKVGNRRKMLLKKGDVIKFSGPKQDGNNVSYRLKILPSGLTQTNEELHARLSADEMSVADRTRKRTHDEIQGTQSPMKVVRSPPRPRPVKKMRQVSQLSQEESQPASELASTTTAQQLAPDSSSQDLSHVTSARAAGKRRRQADVPAPDSRLAELQKENQRLRLHFAGNILNYTNDELAKLNQELKTLREENEAQKKSHEKDLEKVRDQVVSEQKKEMDKLRQERDSLKRTLEDTIVENEALKKSHEKDLEKVRDQVVSDQKKEIDELRQERDSLKRTLEHILVDPKAPTQFRTVAELDIKILELQRKLKFAQEELALQSRQISQETPPSKKQLVLKERERQRSRELVVRRENHAKTCEKMAQEQKEIAKLEKERTEDSMSDPRNLSGSSQSQDSIDYGNLRSDRRNSQGLLSGCSNENSEPSPADQPLTVDEESKNGDASHALFDIYGARRPNSATSSTSSRPTTLSQSHVFRGRRQAESKELQPDEGANEETKGGI